MIIQNIAKDKYLRVVFGLSLLVLIFNFVFSILYVGDVKTPLIIHFDSFNGIDFLGGRADVFGILTAGIVIVILNILLADFLYNRDRFLSFIFAFASLALSILILIAVSVIISVNWYREYARIRARIS